MKPGQLCVFRTDIVVDYFVYSINKDGDCCASELKIPTDCVAIYLRAYKTLSHSQWSVFLFGDQIGVAMTKYFKRVKAQV